MLLFLSAFTTKLAHILAALESITGFIEREVFLLRLKVVQIFVSAL